MQTIFMQPFAWVGDRYGKPAALAAGTALIGSAIACLPAATSTPLLATDLFVWCPAIRGTAPPWAH